MSHSSFRRHLARGYTITELLMSLSVLAIGVSGVIAMQRVTLAANRNAKNISVATRAAEAWADQLTADGMLWTVDPVTVQTTLANTTWLKKTTPSAPTGAWDTPVFSTPLNFGPAFGPLGQPLDHKKTPELAHFCAQIRLAFVQPETTPTTGNGVIRAQIRVFWRREDHTEATPSPGNLCAVTAADLDTFIQAFDVVYVTTSIRQIPAGRTPPP